MAIQFRLTLTDEQGRQTHLSGTDIEGLEERLKSYLYLFFKKKVLPVPAYPSAAAYRCNLHNVDMYFSGLRSYPAHQLASGQWCVGNSSWVAP